MAVCWSCNSAVPDATRWCPICQANQTDPTAGRLASPGKRLGAHIIDTMIFGLFFVFVVVAAVGVAATMGGEEAAVLIASSSDVSPASLSPDAGRAVGIGFLIAGIGTIAYLFLVLAFYSKGTTPGKKMLGMRVIRDDGNTAGLGTMLLREWLGKIISSFVMSLGFIWILIDGNRQGWHDKLVSTYVVE